MERLPPDLVALVAERWLAPREREALRATCKDMRACVPPLGEEQRHYAQFWRVVNGMMDVLDAGTGVDDPAAWAAMYDFSKKYESRRDVFFMKSSRMYKNPRGGAGSALRDLERSYDIYAAPRTHYLQKRPFRLKLRMKLVRLFGSDISMEVTMENATVFMTYSPRLGGWSFEVYVTDEPALDACLDAMVNTALIAPGEPIARKRVAAVRVGFLRHRFEPWFGGHVRQYRVYGLPGPHEFELTKHRLAQKWRDAFDVTP